MRKSTVLLVGLTVGCIVGALAVGRATSGLVPEASGSERANGAVLTADRLRALADLSRERARDLVEQMIGGAGDEGT